MAPPQKGPTLVIEATAKCYDLDPKNCPRTLQAELSLNYGAGCDEPVIRVNGRPTRDPVRLLLNIQRIQPRKGTPPR